MDCKLNVLGSRGSLPVFGKDFEIYGGQTTCFVFKAGKHALVIDCGTGLYDAPELLNDCEVIDVFLTHVHYDHIIGLLQFNIFPKTAKTTFYGTFNKWFNTNNLDDLYRAPFWPVVQEFDNYIDIVNDGSLIELCDGITVQAYPATHPNDTSSLVITINGKKISILADYEKIEPIQLDFSKDSDIMLYDGMFDVDDYSGHQTWGHSTWKDGVDIAKMYNIKQLMITHHNPLYNDEKLKGMEERCKKCFENSIFVKAHDVYDI